MDNHLLKEYRDAISDCITKCENCIEECQALINKCSLRTPIECGVEIGNLVVACTQSIDSCVMVQEYARKHIETCTDVECVKLNHECLNKAENCIRTCQNVIAFCKEREKICIDTTFECIKACQDLSQTCAELKNL